MTSPLATLDAERVLYFVAKLDGDKRAFDRISCVEGEDLKLNFKVKNANDEEVDLTGATVVLNISSARAPDTLLLSKSATVSGADAVFTFNSTESEIDGYNCLKAQLKITKSGKMVVAAFGYIEVEGLIE